MSFRMINFLRGVSLGGVLASVIFNWPWWPLAVIPWAVLNIFGILCTLPLVAFVFSFGAQEDAYSDGFTWFLLFVLPTAISIGTSIRHRFTSYSPVGPPP